MEDPRVAKCITAKRESKSVEFKQCFSPTDARESLEVLKDIVAIANSGGGALAIGIDNAGNVSGTDVKPVLQHDHAKYCDVIRKYTLQDYSDFEVVEAEKEGEPIAVFVINPPDFPIVFVKPGTYAVDHNKQQTAFGHGTVFFRHGAKSEPGTTDDLRRFMHQRMKEMEQQLLQGMRKVVEAPRGSQLDVIGVTKRAASAGLGVRLTKDKDAPGVVAVDRDILCPYRQKEVLVALKKRIPAVDVNSHDIQSVNRVYNIHSKEGFCWQPAFGSRQYSEIYVEWLVEQITKEKDFLAIARQKYYEITHPG